MKEINITKNQITIVDDEDYEDLMKYKWFYNSTGYAVRTISPNKNRKRSHITMHCKIFGKMDGFKIDHINGNRLDNRRCNLRYVTHTQNAQNRKPQKGSSLYKGVHLSKEGNSWVSTIKDKGRVYSLGSYKSEIDAAWVYNVWAESLFGEYARLNII